MTTILSFVIVLGILVLVHELGHFLVAKKLGVKVEKFSIGFGPRLAGFKRGETEYMVSAFPLGGYVKLMGEEPTEETENDPGTFSARPVSHRMAIIMAGPCMNLILTFILLPLVFMLGVNVPAFLNDEARVGWVMNGSPAMEEGILPGDIIRKIDGKTVGTWEDASTIFVSNPGRKLSVTIERSGAIISKDLVPQTNESDGGGLSGIVQPMVPVFGGIKDGFPADKAGLKKGDVVTAVNGKTVTHWIEMSNLIRESGGKKVSLTVKRGDKNINVELTPVLDEASKKYVIGVGYGEKTELKKFGFQDSIREGVDKGLELTYLTFDVLKKLVTGQLSIATLGGPIMIAQATGAAASAGVAEVIFLMAFISLQLGVMNLLPIPVLDGGHVFFLLSELALRKPLSIKTREMAQQIGFVLLILLMIIVSFNDIRRMLSF